MKNKTLLTLPLLLLVSLPAFSQTGSDNKDVGIFQGVKLNWLELRYRNLSLDRVAAAEKQISDAQAKLKQFIDAPIYPDKQKDIFTQKVDIAVLQRELDTAREELRKVDEILAKAMADKRFRKQLERDLKTALARENNLTAAQYARSSGRSPGYGLRNFRINCYSGGYGRYIWVRCRSSWY